jgi:hypothetical protein
VGKAKPPPDDTAIAKERANVFGAGARRDIEVLWLAPEQQVSHAASYEVGLESAPLEPPYDFCRICVDAALVECRGMTNEPRPGVALHRIVSFAFGGRGLDAKRRELWRCRKMIGRSTH